MSVKAKRRWSAKLARHPALRRRATMLAGPIAYYTPYRNGIEIE
jgi:hypothetical protein